MKNKLSVSKMILISTWLVANLACGSQGGNSANVSAGNTGVAPNTTANKEVVAASKRDPKTVCNYLVKFMAGEYKNPYGSGYSCISTYPATTASGRPQNYSYTASGDAENIEKVSLSMLTNNKYSDAAEGEEYLLEASNELWQKVFAAPLPNEIKEAIQTQKGKREAVDKKFAELNEASVSRTPSGGTTYSLRFEFKLPK